MSDLSRFSISVDDDLLQNFDSLIDEQGYENRSEALRDLMRDALVKSKVQNTDESGEVVGSLTLVYDHHAKDLSDKMNDLQHRFYNLIVSVLHIHISHDDCLEVIVLRGDARNVRSIAQSLLSLKGVKHGKLFITLPAQKIIEKKNPSPAHRHSRRSKD